MNEKDVAELALLQALTVLVLAYAKKLNGEQLADPKPLSSDVGPAAKKAGRPKKEEVAAPAATPAAPVVKVDQKAEEEASKKLALDSASAYVRHFSKSTPDGMVRARQVLADKFGGKKIAELDHAQRLAFVGVLKAEMEPVGAAA